MHLKRLYAVVVGAVLLSLVIVPVAEAVIKQLFTLREVMEASEVIATGHIEKVDQEGQTAIATVSGKIKGSSTFTRIKMNIGVGQIWYPKAMMTRLKVGNPILFFYDNNTSRKCLAHTDGIWFQIFGQANKPPENTWWNMTHIEPYMPRTFNGGTPEFIQLVTDVHKGKSESPAPDKTAPTLTFDMVVKRLDKGAGPMPPMEPVAEILVPLRRGENVLAAAVFNTDPDSSDLSLIVQLKADKLVFIDQGSTMRAHIPLKNIPSDEDPTGWVRPEFDDVSWKEGKYGVGYGDADDATVLGSTGSKTRAIYTRARFNVDNPEAVTKLVLGIDYDDAAIVFINGTEVARTEAADWDFWAGTYGVQNHEASHKKPPVYRYFNVKCHPEGTSIASTP